MLMIKPSPSTLSLVQAVACPQCGALAGTDCLNTAQGMPHLPRVLAANQAAKAKAATAPGTV